MTEDLPRTPEGDLIRRARDRAVPKLSIRAAAARIGISPEHWGNIERGHKSAGANEEPRRLDISPALIAKMALAVGVTPEQLETTGKRPDAAGELREIQRRDGAAAADQIEVLRPAGPEPLRRRERIPYDEDGPEGLEPYLQAVRHELYGAIGMLDQFAGRPLPEPAQVRGAAEVLAGLPGTVIFSTDYEANLWNDESMTLREKEHQIAYIRKMRQDFATREQRNAVLIR